MESVIVTRTDIEEICIKLLHSWRIYNLHQTSCVRTWDGSTWQMVSDEWDQASCPALVSTLRLGRICGRPQRGWQWLALSQGENPPPQFASSFLVSLVKEWILAALGVAIITYYCHLLQGLTQGGSGSFQRGEHWLTAVLTSSRIFCYILWDAYQ